MLTREEADTLRVGDRVTHSSYVTEVFVVTQTGVSEELPQAVRVARLLNDDKLDTYQWNAYIHLLSVEDPYWGLDQGPDSGA